MTARWRRPPKYSCSICNKTFKSKKSHYNHAMKAHKTTKSSPTTSITIADPIEELNSPSYPIIHASPEQLTTSYTGRTYTNNYQLVTGNRHLRTGIPFINDPLRRDTTKLYYSGIPNQYNLGSPILLTGRILQQKHIIAPHLRTGVIRLAMDSIGVVLPRLSTDPRSKSAI